MQKLDFVKKIQEITSELKSTDILAHFKAGFNQPDNNYNYGLINPILFTSKSRFDILISDSYNETILTNLGASGIYLENNLASLTSLLRTNKASNLLQYPQVIQLYTLHDTLVNLSVTSQSLLLSNDLMQPLNESLENGLVIFTIVIEEIGLSPTQYSSILNKLDELIKTINKVLKASENSDEEGQEETSQIVLLDSGSSTNLGIKTTAETAKSLFLIFKEIWDFITNHRFYQNRQKNEAFLESLSIREEIKKKQEAGVLTEEEAKEYTHIIKSRTDSLIGMKVLPKTLVESSTTIDNRNLLNEYKEMKLLSE